MQSTKTILIISNNPELYATKALVNAIKDNGLRPIILRTDELENNRHILNECLFVINRNTGLNYNDEDLDVLSKDCKAPIVNSVSCSRILRDKLVQYRYFKDILGSEKMIETKELIDNGQFLTKSQKWIIKTIRGQKGYGVRTSTDLATDRRQIIESADLNYIIQPYFEMRYEWRVICIGKTQKIIIRKSPKHTEADFQILNFKNSLTKNFAVNDTPKEVMNITQAIESSLDFHFITVDILEGLDGQFKFLEANSSAGMAYTDLLIGEQGLADLLIKEMLKYLNT